MIAGWQESVAGCGLGCSESTPPSDTGHPCGHDHTRQMHSINRKGRPKVVTALSHWRRTLPSGRVARAAEVAVRASRGRRRGGADDDPRLLGSGRTYATRPRIRVWEYR